MMRIAMIGTRGVPARYGGFETAVEEIGSRLVENGNEVTVYCRGARGDAPTRHRGMQLVHLPAIHLKAAETLSHTALSVAHAVTRRRPDAAFVFNSANAPFLPILSRLGVPTAVHVDGLEWKRDKWSKSGKEYYRWAEAFAVRWADALISDAVGIANYYKDEFSIDTEIISYGAPILTHAGTDRLAALGLVPGKYHLVVARFEPENHVDVIVDGFRQGSAKYPLVVVGDAPYAAAHTQKIRELAASDKRVKLLGSVYDQEALDQLYANALTYIHGHSVGGTNPSLLRAMGAGTAVIAWDVVFNREVTGSQGGFFENASSLARMVDSFEQAPEKTTEKGRSLQSRARSNYDWDLVADAYYDLATRLAAGYSNADRAHRRTPMLASSLSS